MAAAGNVRRAIVLYTTLDTSMILTHTQPCCRYGPMCRVAGCQLAHPGNFYPHIGQICNYQLAHEVNQVLVGAAASSPCSLAAGCKRAHPVSVGWADFNPFGFSTPLAMEDAQHLIDCTGGDAVVALLRECDFGRRSLPFEAIPPPAEMPPAEMPLAEMPLAEMPLAEMPLAEMRPPEMPLAEMRPPEMPPAEMPLAEMRPAGMRPAGRGSRPHARVRQGY